MKILPGCEESCSCQNGVLYVTSYSCSSDAVCTLENNTSKCTCNELYWGDGVTCKRVRDCQDIYNYTSTEDGIYSIYPVSWPGSPFKVYCQDGWTVSLK